MAHLIACPECKKHLQVPDEFIGKKVQCPECKHTFTAPAAEQESPSSTPAPPVPSVPKETKKPSWEKKTSIGDDDEDDRPSKRKKKRKDYDDDDDDPYGVDDRDDDDDDRPRRRRRRRASGHYMPHRGGMILAFGLIGLIGLSVFPIGLIFAIIAWIMGNGDMEEIRSGRMDPEGEGMTQAGRIMGIISTIIHIVSVVAIVVPFGFCCLLGMIGAAGGGGRPPRRF